MPSPWLVAPSLVIVTAIHSTIRIAAATSAVRIRPLVRRVGRGRVAHAKIPTSTAYAFLNPSIHPSRLPAVRPYASRAFATSSGLALNNNNATMDDNKAKVPDEAIQLMRKRKQSFRKQIRSRIKSTYPPSATELLTERSDDVFDRFFALPQYRDAKSVGFFLSMPFGEIQTRSAVRRIVNDGKALFVPRVGLDFEACDMDLVRCDTAAGADDELFYDAWPRNKWGIPEPPVTETNAAQPGDIDLLIVPGLAFDTHGHRLGQGKGYYDRFIAKMRNGGGNGTKPLLVGVCLEEQFLDEVPHGIDVGVEDDGRGHIIPVSDHDYVMDVVLTPSRMLDVQKK